MVLGGLLGGTGPGRVVCCMALDQVGWFVGWHWGGLLGGTGPVAWH